MGNVVVDEDVGGGGAKACHYRRGHVTAVEEVAAQTAVIDVLWTRPSEGEREGGGCRCRQGHGMTAEVVTSAGVAAQGGCGGGRIEQMSLLDGCIATAASDAARCACKRLQGSFCSAVTWPRSLFAFVDAAGATIDTHTSSFTPLVQLSSDLGVPNHSGCARNILSTFSMPIKGATLCPARPLVTRNSYSVTKVSCDARLVTLLPKKRPEKPNVFVGDSSKLVYRYVFLGFGKIPFTDLSI